MTKRLISFFLALVLLVVVPLTARYRYNPFTTKLDYYEAAGDADLGDIGDVTLTGVATGNILYYNGTAWVNLATGANTNVLTLVAGVPAWQAGGAPAAHAASHEVGGADLVDHDQLTNYLAAQHLTLPNTLVAVLTDHNAAAHVALGFLALPSTIAAVLTDHNLLAHTALGLFDQSSDVDHDLTTNYLAAQHLTLPSTIVAVLTDHNKAAHDALLIDADTVDGEHAAAIVTNVRVKAHFPDTIANVLNDHNLLAHTALGLFDQSSDVDHNATTNYFIYNHVGEDHLVEHTLWIGWLAGQDLAVGGQYNTLVGEQAGTDITTGDDNTIVGYQAGFTRTTTSRSTFVGYQAGYQNLGDDNTAVGYQALYNDGAQSGDTLKNVAIGAFAMYEAGDETAHNVAVGYDALRNVTGETEYNVAIGRDAMLSATAGQRNAIVGAMASYHNVTPTDNIVIGYQAGYGVATNTYDDNVFIGRSSGYGTTTGGFNTFVGNYSGMTHTIGLRNSVFGYMAAEDLTTGDDNIVIGYMAGEGWLDTENEKLVIDVTDTTTPLIYGDFSADNITINGDFNVTMDAVADQLAIAQTAVAGPGGAPLININDDRTGVTADTVGEATIVIDAEGTYAMYVMDGGVWLGTGSLLVLDATLRSQDGRYLAYGTSNDWLVSWDSNNAADWIWAWTKGTVGAGDTAAIFISTLNPSDMTDHDNYLSPTFVLTNDEGADANDYSGVVIGERAQANVKVMHYFDFYAMTGASDGSVVSADELPAIFRFGANGTGVPTYATTGGDVLMEGQLEVDGNTQVAGYRRADTVRWIVCFDHGIAANRYSQNWDITSLNTQGAGTNTIDTTPSEITLTTDNNAIGDNEGTITHFQIVQRSRQNRSEFEVELGQTANTQFYCGWNTSQTNAMVAAADEYVIVFFDVSDNANWQIKVGDGATEDVFTSAIAGAVAHIIHEIWVETDGTVHWRVNGTELDITGSVDNLMTANNHYLIFGQAQSVTGAAAIVVEIDYVENEKTKVH